MRLVRGLVAWLLPFVVGGALTLVPRVAAAQATDRVLAEALFREGRELMEQNKITEACSKFAESYRLDRALGTLINLALCHEKDGKIGTAWAEFTDAAAEAAAEKDDREGFTRRHIATLEQDLPRLRLVVAPATASLASLEIQLDGHTIGNAGWALPLPIDPGDHTLRATAEGKKTFEMKVTVPKGLGLTDANVPALEDAPKPIVVPPPPPPSNEPAPSHTQRTVGFIVGGVGVTSALVGAAFGFSAISLKGDRDARCNAQGTLCDQEGIDKDGKARDAATVSTIAFIAGGALIAGGAVLVFTAPKKKSLALRTLKLGFTPTSIGLGGAF
jgi:hypothetical protein